MIQRHGYVYDLLRNAGMGDFGARTVEFFVDRPLRILFILALAVVVIRIGRRAAARIVRGLTLRAQTSLGRRGRAETRAETLGAATGGLVGIVVWIVAGLSILRELGIDVAPLIAGAGIAGLAIGFGAQSLVRDVLAGLFILAEDRFGVGDQIDAGLASGTVEDVNLRVTRLRGVDGTVWFVPNGEIRRVGNQSMEWSKAVVDVLVSYGNDVPTVLALVGEEAGLFAVEPAWVDVLLDAPEVWGVQASAAEGLTVRVVVKTVTAAQGRVGRELRTRILVRLSAEGIRLPGIPYEASSPGSAGGEAEEAVIPPP